MGERLSKPRLKPVYRAIWPPAEERRPLMVDVEQRDDDELEWRVTMPNTPRRVSR